MNYEEIKKWLEDNNYQNSGLRIDKNHRVDLYLSDVLYDFTQQQLKKYIISSAFIREWKCAKEILPSESGRYWCLVKEQNDLGISYYQWNCSYVAGIGFSIPHYNDIEITHWTELLPTLI